jgi:hypothetical protein
MKNLLVTFLLMVVLALPGRAEFLQMEIAIFGMD